VGRFGIGITRQQVAGREKTRKGEDKDNNYMYRGTFSGGHSLIRFLLYWSSTLR